MSDSGEAPRPFGMFMICTLPAPLVNRNDEEVDKLLDVGGASRFAESSPVERIWRDLGTATRHPAFVTEIDRERYARMLLGLNEQ